MTKTKLLEFIQGVAPPLIGVSGSECLNAATLASRSLDQFINDANTRVLVRKISFVKS